MSIYEDSDAVMMKGVEIGKRMGQDIHDRCADAAGYMHQMQAIIQEFAAHTMSCPVCIEIKIALESTGEVS